MHVLLNRNQNKTELHSVIWSLLIFDVQRAVVQNRMACLQRQLELLTHFM